MLNFYELNKKYVGKEVKYDEDKKAHISKLTSYQIEIKTEAEGWHLVYKTGTGPNDDAVTRGDVRFVDGALQKEFIGDYGQYVDSEEGRTQAWLYYAQFYD